jgi:hypothetical protein
MDIQAPDRKAKKAAFQVLSEGASMSSILRTKPKICVASFNQLKKHKSQASI